MKKRILISMTCLLLLFSTGCGQNKEQPDCCKQIEGKTNACCEEKEVSADNDNSDAGDEESYKASLPDDIPDCCGE